MEKDTLIDGDMTKIYLKDICDQLTDAVGLSAPYRVAANLDVVSCEIFGWLIVKRDEETGKITPTGERFGNIQELFEMYRNGTTD